MLVVLVALAFGVWVGRELGYAGAYTAGWADAREELGQDPTPMIAVAELVAPGEGGQ